jgi:diaminohydroxyphosphoribosylaminopyrimidine deaminase/5-amino-6-(5-phosphoribosylamino)uracil reductase
MIVTLEPCSHHGRTGPCAEAIIAAGIAKVIIGTIDPDPRVSGSGIELLKASGVDVEVGIEEEAVRAQLAPYIWHRVTGRPYVVLKVASTLDGVVAMADGTSQWITGEDARRDAHVLRAQSQAVLVGAGTVRSDDPALTARLGDLVLEPLRVVLGTAPERAKIRPCLEMSGDLGHVLDELGQHDVLQLLVEGGPTTASSFLEAGLVNHVVWYQSASFGGATGTLGALAGLATPTIAALRRGRVVDVRQVGEDIRIDVEV